MKKFTSFFVSITLVLIITAAYGCKNKKVIHPAKQYAVEDFFRNPEKTNFSLSPDGKYYAYMAPYKNRMNIFVQEIGKESVIWIYLGQ
jgi:hypothetical protein